jgi:DNA polymerase I-like protein with 3'-5' exonuclease and polymerase domains
MPWVVEQDEGVFIGGDLAQAELHCLSQTCHKLFGYSRMGELLNQNVDLHWHFAATSLGITIEEVKKLGKEHRDRAKPANFGFPGGMGPEKFVLYSRKGYGVQFKIEEVKPLKEKWLNTFPEVREYLAWIGEQGDHGDSITIVHPITGSVRGGMRYTAAANNGFQHLCAYAAKVALVEVTVACFTPGNPLFGWRIWNFVHDEILLEGPRRGASSAAKELARIMTECFSRFTPTYPTHVDAFVTKVWSKQCSTVLCPTTGDILEWIPSTN